MVFEDIFDLSQRCQFLPQKSMISSSSHFHRFRFWVNQKPNLLFFTDDPWHWQIFVTWAYFNRQAILAKLVKIEMVIAKELLHLCALWLSIAPHKNQKTLFWSKLCHFEETSVCEGFLKKTNLICLRNVNSFPIPAVAIGALWWPITGAASAATVSSVFFAFAWFASFLSKKQL